LPRGFPDVRAVIEALYAGSSLENLALALSHEVRSAAERLTRPAAKALSLSAQPLDSIQRLAPRCFGLLAPVREEDLGVIGGLNPAQHMCSGTDAP
jgi:hypothetical protein